MLSFSSEAVRPQRTGIPTRRRARRGGTRQTGVISRKVRPAWCCCATPSDPEDKGQTPGRPEAGHGAAAFGSAR